MQPATVCDFETDVVPAAGLDAHTDGDRAVATSALAAFAANDGELAAIPGHEMAQGLLAERAPSRRGRFGSAFRALGLDPRARERERRAGAVDRVPTGGVTAAV